jgi:hypothetical protein
VTSTHGVAALIDLAFVETPMHRLMAVIAVGRLVSL